MRAVFAPDRSTRTSSGGSKAVLFAAAALTLAGCANLRWENPAVPQERWAEDQRSCTASSYSEARQFYEDPFLTRDMHQPGVDGDLARLRYTQNQERQRRHAADAFERCMKAKGYSRVAQP